MSNSPASVVGQNKRCVTGGDALGALHLAPGRVLERGEAAAVASRDKPFRSICPSHGHRLHAAIPRLLTGTQQRWEPCWHGAAATLLRAVTCRGHCSELEGKGSPSGPGQTADPAVLLAALPPPHGRDFVPVSPLGNLPVSPDCAHPERLGKVFLPETGRRGKCPHADKATTKRAECGLGSGTGRDTPGTGDSNIPGSQRGVEQSFPWGLRCQEPRRSQKLKFLTQAGAGKLLGLTISSYQEVASRFLS